MFKKIKQWLAVVAASLGIGYQVQRPPVMETTPPPILSTERPSPTPAVVPVVVATPPPAQVNPSVQKKPKMILGKITGATDDEVKMIRQAIDNANKIMASDCFMNRILEAKFTETNKLSNSQIWNLLSEKPIKIGAEMYDGSWKENYVWKTMGYDIGDGVVYMNRFFVEDALTISSLSTHEAEGHGQGFRHDNEDAMETTVPYKLNDFIESCAKKVGIRQEQRSNANLFIQTFKHVAVH